MALIRNPVGQILFLQRSAKTSRPLQWCLPGGKIKGGESPTVALTREVKEETGLDVLVVGRLADFSDQSYWNCELLRSDAVTLNARESRAFAWCHLNQILELGFIMDLTRLQQILEGLESSQKHGRQ